MANAAATPESIKQVALPFSIGLNFKGSGSAQVLEKQVQELEAEVRALKVSKNSMAKKQESLEQKMRSDETDVAVEKERLISQLRDTENRLRKLDAS